MRPDLPDPCDVAIIGAGAAGMTAAPVLAAAGLKLVIIDEQLRWGGQILRQPPAPFTVSNWLQGGSYHALKRQLRLSESLTGATFLSATSVVGLFPVEDGFTLYLSSSDGMMTLTARRLLLAPGCYDLPAPLPGWTLPGVMTVGGIQAFIKAQLLLPGAEILLAGSHPLQLILARQIIAAGGRVKAVLFAQPWSAALRLLRHPVLMAQNWRPLTDAALALLSLRRAGVDLRFGWTVKEAIGADRLTSVMVGPVPALGERDRASTETLSCDLLGLGFGFLPQSELARLAGAEEIWAAGGWAIRHDDWMQSSRPGLFVAGEITGVAGAAAAMLEGALAAQGILLDCGRQSAADAARVARPWRRRHRQLSRFAKLLAELADPDQVLERLVTPDTILCRCESVRLRDIETICDGLPGPVRDASAVKLACRIGMGLCQGRQCESSLLRLLSARQGDSPGNIKGFTPRFPAKPLPIADLLDIGGQSGLT